MAERMAAPTRIATLGMFIIDEFQFINPDTDEDEGDHGHGDQVGGGGTYFIIGARIWKPPSELGMLIDKGSDFPANIEAELVAYDQTPTQKSKPTAGSSASTMWKYRPRADGLGTTRAVNIYKGQQRGFKYLTPKVRLDPHDLLYPSGSVGSVLLLPTYIHFICAPERAGLVCDEVEALLRSRRAGNARRPVLVWEPLPESALPENLDECVKVMRRIDVFSPNHDEAAAFLSVDPSSVNLPANWSTLPYPAALTALAATRTAIITHLLRPFLDLGTPAAPATDEARPRFGSEGPIVLLRSGAAGAVVAHRRCGHAWVGAYHVQAEAHLRPPNIGAGESAIRDVTGAGNACLGGFTAALSAVEENVERALGSSGDGVGEELLRLLEGCAARASVSASFVIEQQGLPVLSVGGGGELWNGEAAQTRLANLEQAERDGR